ncbi:MAG: hypothetical protein M3020_08235 [Myxococcota bacterium]|nr:hypothetical protein [Myxococcota bacterium]
MPDPWTQFLAKARRFELRLARHDWKLADDFVALFVEYARVVVIVMDEARARGTARGITAGFQEFNAQLERLAESEERLDASLAKLRRSPAPPVRPKRVGRTESRSRAKTRSRAR